MFRTSPGFAAAVVLTLALGLGANATMFGAVDRVLLSPPEHVQDHEELRFVHLTGLGPRSLNSPMSYSFPDYEAIRGLPVLAGAAAYRPGDGLRWGPGSRPVERSFRTRPPSSFLFWGSCPRTGDSPTPRTTGPVAVLGHGFWDREFGRDSSAVGRTVTLGSYTYEVVGVAPRGFTGANLEVVDVWVPLRMNLALTNNWSVLESRGVWWFHPRPRTVWLRVYRRV